MDRAIAPIGWALFLIGSALVAARAGAQAPPLDRPYDAVIIKTAALAALPDRETRRLRLVRRRGATLEPAPFQLDAVDRNGDVRLDDAEFAFDADDELVFMAADAGERATIEQLPPDADAVLEIEVADPAGSARGWAYLLHYATPPPLAHTAPYVTLDPSGQRARSRFYEADYADGRNYFTGLRVTADAGGSGVNLLRRTTMTGQPTLRFLVTDVDLRFDEESTIVHIDGVKTGPVRAIRQVRLAVDLGRFFPELPSGTVHTYHYARSFDTPSRVSVPWLVLKTLRAFRFENTFELDPAALPLRYWDGANRDGIDLAAPAPTGVVVGADHDWWVVSGPAGSILHAMEIPAEWRAAGIARGSVVRGRIASGEIRPAAGYNLLHMTRLPHAGGYQLRQATVILPRPYHPGDEAAPLAMLHQPLQADVRRLR